VQEREGALFRATPASKRATNSLSCLLFLALLVLSSFFACVHAQAGRQAPLGLVARLRFSHEHIFQIQRTPERGNKETIVHAHTTPSEIAAQESPTPKIIPSIKTAYEGHIPSTYLLHTTYHIVHQSHALIR
jgi:hypothetical protein